MEFDKQRQQKLGINCKLENCSFPLAKSGDCAILAQFFYGRVSWGGADALLWGRSRVNTIIQERRMSKAISVSIAKRELYGTANSRRLRRAGMIPAVVYGHGNPAQAITITPEEAEKIEYHNGLVELNCDCGEKKTAIVKEIQRHPINPGILHIDFQEVAMDEIINSVVPVILEGEPVGTKQGGQLEQVMMEIEVKSLPANMPESIIVDVSGVELDAAIHVKDLVLPEGVTAAVDEELVVCHVRTVKAEEEPAAEAAEGEAAEAPAAEEKK